MDPCYSAVAAYLYSNAVEGGCSSMSFQCGRRGGVLQLRVVLRLYTGFCVRPVELHGRYLQTHKFGTAVV